MKKLLCFFIIIVSILTCMVGCYSADADDEVLPDLKYGKYYLNGDAQSQVYLELTADYVRMSGAKLYEFWEADYRKMMPHITDEAVIKESVQEMVSSYSAECAYNFTTKNGDTTVYRIYYSADKDTIDKTTDSGTFYEYYADGKITIGPENCYFALVE